MLPTVACLKIKLLKFSITYDIIQQRHKSSVFNSSWAIKKKKGYLHCI